MTTHRQDVLLTPAIDLNAALHLLHVLSEHDLSHLMTRIRLSVPPSYRSASPTSASPASEPDSRCSGGGTSTQGLLDPTLLPGL